MSKLKRILIWVVAVFSLLVGSASYLAYVYQDEIILTGTQQLNSYLNTEIVPEKMEVSFIKKFPYASIELKNVTAFESWSHTQKDTLFHFESVYLKFNLFDLYKGNYTLEAAEFSNGKAHFITDSGGNINYDFWKSNTADTTSSQLQFSLKKVSFHQVEFLWDRETAKEHIHVFIENAQTKGDFGSEAFQMDVFGDFSIHQLQFDQVELLAQQHLQLDVGFDVDLNTKTYRFYRGNTTIDNTLQLSITGVFSPETYSLSLAGKNIGLEKAISILPRSQQTQLSAYQLSGTCDLSITLQKEENEKAPLINTDFELQQASWSKKESQLSVQGISASGFYTNGDQRNWETSEFRLTTFQAQHQKTSVTGAFSIVNFNNSLLKAQLKCTGELSDLENLINIDTVEQASGKVDVDLELQLKAKHLFTLDSAQFHLQKTTGKLALTNAQFSLVNSSLQVTELSTQSRFDQQYLVIDSLKATALNSHLSFKGKIKNFLSWKEEKPAEIIGNLQTDYLNAIEWENAFTSASSPEETSADWPAFFTIESNISIQDFKRENIEAQSIKGNLTYQHNQLVIRNLSTHLLEGQARINMRVSNYQNGQEFFMAGNFGDVNLQKAFEMFNNFGQESILARHIVGTAFADFSVKFPIIQQEVNTEQLELEADVTIQKGELINYELLQETVAPIEENKVLRLLVNLDDFKRRLQHVKFDQLRNTLSIKNQMLSIPEMQISSSALNIELNGSHTFNNDIDYALNFNLKEVLVKDKDVKVTEYGYIKDDNLGNKQIFLRITGTVDHPVIALDKTAARSYRKEVAKKEVKTAKSVMKEELGWFKNDTTLPDLKEPTEAEYQMDFGEFDTTASPSEKAPRAATDTTIKKKVNRFLKEISQPKKEKKSKFEEWEFEEEDL